MSALWTDTKNKILTTYQFVTIPKRNKKSALTVPANQKFFHRETPCQRTVLEPPETLRAARNLLLASRPCFFDISFNPIKRRIRRGIRVGRQPGGEIIHERGPLRRRHFMERSVVGMQSRELRTNNHVFASLYLRRGLPTRNCLATLRSVLRSHQSTPGST